MPVHPLTGKHIHAIAAVNKNGTQRDFSKNEKQLACRLGLDSRSLLIHKPAVTTINNLASMYYEASRLIPMLTVKLEDLFEYEDRDRHFWSTNAGRGQCLAYILQAAFTLELSLKAILEVGGRLTTPPSRGRPDWQTHSPVRLFELLDDDERQRLEQWWKVLSLEERHFDGTYLEFLKSVDDLYIGLRYLQWDLEGTNSQLAVLSLLSASRVALELAEVLFRERFPCKVNVTTHVHTDPKQPVMRSERVEGFVRSVTIPESFDPHGRVEVIIEPDHGDGDVTASFRKADVEDYYGIEGDRVRIVGFTSDTEPFVLHGSDHVDHSRQSQAKPCYTHEHRVLSGSVYNLETYEIATGQRVVRLVLDDATFFSKVECIFSTNQEQKQLANVTLGQEILIRGQVSLRDGRPMVLLGPEIVDANRTGNPAEGPTDDLQGP